MGNAKPATMTAVYACACTSLASQERTLRDVNISHTPAITCHKIIRYLTFKRTRLFFHDLLFVAANPLSATISSTHNYDTRHEVVTRDSSGSLGYSREVKISHWDIALT